jgi:molybdopterin-binding protein
MQYGARNKVIGEVTSIKKGTIMSQIQVKVPAEACLESVMTLDSLNELDLQPGDKVRVIVKAVNVLLVKE